MMVISGRTWFLLKKERLQAGERVCSVNGVESAGPGTEKKDDKIYNSGLYTLSRIVHA